MSVQVKLAYEPLNEQTVLDVIKPLNFFETASSNELVVQEIGDGNLNLVFRIQDPHTKQALIVKQALPYAKVVGESWPLTLDRARIESDALVQEAESVPHLVPKVYYSDPQLAVTVMEDLSDHVILRKGLIEGNTYPQLAEDIGTFAANTAFYSSDFYLHPFEKKDRVKKFSNPELCKITEDLVFTDPFFNHDTNDFPSELQKEVEKIWTDQPLLREVAQLRFSFLTRAEILLHGDLHTGSVFVKSDSTKVIDPEFAFYGPAGFDLAHFFANLILNHLSQNVHAREPFHRESVQSYLLQTIEKTWETYRKTFKELWHEKSSDPFAKTEGVLENFLQYTFQEAIGFAGCEVIRRTIGLAHVADLDSIKQKDIELFYKKKALELGSCLIKNQRKFTSITQLTEWIRGA
ncbi:S-methyl-5-thioribose kinase [Fictibacillus phosphorivorans]|uniref:S-methyl-5-thioribose kinase n=1 Tax=Fictibacillus phosphorivorans TaxID=1221500 RepID=UPI002041D97A|nr:S-methyl-5-thioribose kinase [Fictibacillus phosphorivorans]MCM3718681.1 S-methyl-5-thioribose kinase [Fictibacillus phosphorivorans]MCM3776304.1 S-methyl-5-thioribose kinase [Fictibacillus phosphorivorans]